jgi:hypothetical protein
MKHLGVFVVLLVMLRQASSSRLSEAVTIIASVFPRRVTICATPQPPFVLPSRPETYAFGDLHNHMEYGVSLTSSEVVGIDVELSALVFGTIVGVPNVSYVVCASLSSVNEMSIGSDTWPLFLQMNRTSSSTSLCTTVGVTWASAGWTPVMFIDYLAFHPVICLL